MARILVFGDSIVYGAWDSKGGWVERLKEFLDKRFLLNKNLYFLTYNLGISGDTTKDILERFEFELKMRFKEKEDTIIIFSIGVNDSEFDNKKKKTKINISQFEKNILELIKVSSKFSNKIIFTGLTPVDKRVNPIPWYKGYSYKNKLIKKYESSIRRICSEKKIYFIEIFDALNDKDLDDGCHPNSKGHEKIFERIQNFLIKKKLI